MRGTRLKSFELMVLLQFFFNSLDKVSHPQNMQSSGDSEIYAFWDGRNIVKSQFKKKEKYEDTFDKLVKLGFIQDWGTFQHLTYKGINYINSL
tara:strand:+ start:52 stop:330 length:279 start_codon:yes stop_codon:yes gene_type:complete